MKFKEAIRKANSIWNKGKEFYIRYKDDGGWVCMAKIPISNSDIKEFNRTHGNKKAEVVTEKDVVTVYIIE